MLRMSTFGGNVVANILNDYLLRIARASLRDVTLVILNSLRVKCHIGRPLILNSLRIKCHIRRPLI